MRHPSRFKVTREIGIRMLADALMVNAALLIAFTARYLWLIGVEAREVSPQIAMSNYLTVYLGSFWLLTAICLAAFSVSGFYTHGRHYSGRYKILVIVQTVSASYLIFGMLILLLWDVLSFPRSVLPPAWLLTLAFLIGARQWATAFRTASRVEHWILPARPTVDDTIRNVLVIGGAGYIGSALLPKLLERGYKVRLLDLLLYGTEPIQDVLNHPRLELVQADFLLVDKVVEAMYGMDAVIHLGAIVGDPACALDEQLTIEVNLMATRMIAEVAKGLGVKRFLFASTCSVYGASDETLDERSALKPVSLYARSKIASEKALLSMVDDRFTPVILRFATIFGLSGRTRFDLVVNLLTAKAMVDGQITVFGGDQWRPFVHVDDAAYAVLKAMEAPRLVVRNQVFNVGSNEQNYTLYQAGELIQRLVPTAELIDKGMDGDRRNYRVDFTKIRRAIGFEPRWTLETGVQQVIQAIQSGRVRNYRDPKHSNVAYLSTVGMSRFTGYNNGHTYDLLNEAIARLAYDRPFSPVESKWPYELIAMSGPLSGTASAA